MCRSRRELSNAYLLAKFGFDTAENEPFQVCPLSAYRSPRFVDIANRVPHAKVELLSLTICYIINHVVLQLTRDIDTWAHGSRTGFCSWSLEVVVRRVKFESI